MSLPPGCAELSGPILFKMRYNRTRIHLASSSLPSLQDNLSSVRDITESALPPLKLAVHCDNQMDIFQTSLKFWAQEPVITFQWIAWMSPHGDTCNYICDIEAAKVEIVSHIWSWLKRLHIVHKTDKFTDITHSGLWWCLLVFGRWSKWLLHKTCPSKLFHLITFELSSFFFCFFCLFFL